MDWQLQTMSKHVQSNYGLSSVPKRQGDTETPRAPRQTPKVTGEPLRVQKMWGGATRPVDSKAKKSER